MSELKMIKHKRVRSRKIRACEICGHKAIQAKEMYWRTTNVYDGKIYDWVSCAPCDLMTDDVWGYHWQKDGLDADNYVEWVDENPLDPRAISFRERMGWGTQ